MTTRLHTLFTAALLLLVGFLSGALLTRTPTAQAQVQSPVQFRQCTMAAMHGHGRELAFHLNGGRIVNTTPVPMGWVPVGGSDGHVVFCR